MANQRIHVVPHADGWAVRMEGTDEVASVYPNQREAIQNAMDVAADKEMNLVVHREDGQFGEVMKYEEIRDNGGRGGALAQGTLGIGVQDLLAVRSRVSWGAIFAGLVTAITVYTLLGALGAAVGLSAAGAVSGSSLMTGAAIWALLSMLIALFLGGYVTSQVTAGESHGEAALYGVLLWGTLCVRCWGSPGSAVNDPGFGGLLQRSRAR